MKSIELKIKAKHLALESGVIKHEEVKLRNNIKWVARNKGTQTVEFYATQIKFERISSHRRGTVRNEARATHLAQAYLMGKHYNQVECKRRPEHEYAFWNYVMPSVFRMIKKYGNSRVTPEQVSSWVAKVEHPEAKWYEQSFVGKTKLLAA